MYMAYTDAPGFWAPPARPYSAAAPPRPTLPPRHYPSVTSGLTWLYLAASYTVAISAAFPAFLIAREIRISKSDAPGLRTLDTILLAVVAILTAVLTIWIDVG